MDRWTRAARKPLFVMALVGLTAAAPSEDARWREQAARVTITRDDWGIAHVHGRTDADAVFGAIYAQAEDDFPRIEANYLTALGRTAEADGESAIWADLRQRLYYNPADLQAKYRAAPPWLKALMNAWADGLNFYLATHPAVKPRVLTRFEPWMALSFTEGSIGGDIERIDLAGLANFYGPQPKPIAARWEPNEPRGSNGIAIAPQNTANGRALLLINPHTSFYFRAELQMTSDQGLNAYGASTWGQFFIYQGFNADAGWMHTSSGVDNVDEFVEQVKHCGQAMCWRDGGSWRPLEVRTITLRYRTADGRMGARTIPTYRTAHGPVVAAGKNGWLSFAMMSSPVPALEQSWLRTKARDLKSYIAVAARRANSSNATLYADRRGGIAYLHPQFVPVRDGRFDYTKPVDGADPATRWRGLHPVAALPNAINPRSGWAMNTNNWPWTTAGTRPGDGSPQREAFPRYMDSFGENARGEQAVRLLTDRKDWTAERLMAAAYDPYLTGFARLIPQLVADYDAQPSDSPYRKPLAAQIALLRQWDFRWGADSTATSLAVFWGDAMGQEAADFMRGERLNLPDYIATQTTPQRRLAALAEASDRLAKDFGDWRVPWGRINRFQRLTAAIAPRFDDAAPSSPVPFTSAQWGSLASFGAKRWPGTKKYYGSSGNSFVAVVEFGPRVRAWAVTAGGASGDPASPHFRDQIDRYADGRLRPVYFHPDELAGHVARRYRPGG